MGEDRGADGRSPLRIVVDDLGAAQTAARRMRLERRPAQPLLGIAGALYVIAALELGLAALRIASHEDISRWWLQAAMGCTFILNARVQGGGGRSALVPTEFTITDAGIDVTARGADAPRAYAWKDVRSVSRGEGGFLVTTGLFNRPIFVPVPAGTALMDDAWRQFYRHLVARRGLRPTPLDRLGVLYNSANGNGSLA